MYSVLHTVMRDVSCERDAGGGTVATKMGRRATPHVAEAYAGANF